MHTQSILYGLGAVGLGVTGLVFADFPLQWQPVPDAVPGRTMLALANALLLIAGGLLSLTRPFAVRGALVLALLYGLSVVLLHAPRVLSAPLDILPWLGLAELLALAAAGLMLALLRRQRAGLARMRRIQVVFGACPLVFGLSHFAYPEFTAQMIPEWIPLRLFWAYVTGAAHIAAGLAILAGALMSEARIRAIRVAAAALARLAAAMLTAMLALFTLLVHVPDVAADPGSHRYWTMLFVATSLTGAAWITASTLTVTRVDRPAVTEANPGSAGTTAPPPASRP